MTLVPEGAPGARPVVVTVLEMLDPADLRPSPEPSPGADRPPHLLRVEPPDAALSARCYAAVGAPWSWVDRLGWTDAQWQEWVGRPGHELWVLQTEDGLAGYFELDPDGAGSVEIAYFGLVPGYEGHGLGGWLLSRALRRGWELPGTRRLWVHTCELDGPAALPNYRARGMRDCGTWVEDRLLPAASVGGMALRIQCVCIDADDPSPVAAFWEGALGWRRTFDDADEIVLEPPAGSPEEGVVPDLIVLRVPEGKATKNRLHLDLRPADQDAEVARLESLGATRVDVGQRDGDVTWVVMADPGGNEFCVLRALRPDEA